MKMKNKRKILAVSITIVIVVTLIVILGFTSIGASLSPALFDKVIWDDSPTEVYFPSVGTYYIFVKRIYTVQSSSVGPGTKWSVSIYYIDENSGAQVKVLETGCQKFELNRFYVWGFTITKPGTYKVAVYNDLRCYCQTSKFHIVIKPGLFT